MNNTVGFDFYFYDQTEETQLIVFPITPPKLKVTVGSKNEVVDLINEGEINILKTPSLIDIEFEARFPMRQYPFSRDVLTYSEYFDVFRTLKNDGIPFRFIMIHGTKYGNRKLKEPTYVRKYQEFKESYDDFNYNVLVAIEDMEITEDADNGDDVLINFKLRQYKPYGTRYLNLKDGTITTSTSTTWREVLKSSGQQEYTVKEGDTLSLISKNFYGDAQKWTVIYDANKTTIENAAKKYGRQSSSNGHWIYPGTKLIIPAR